MTDQNQLETDKDELRAAWGDLIASVQDARDIIDSPDRYALEPTSRVLAEGYRYLAGFVHRGIERTFHAEPKIPSSRNALSMFNKWMITYRKTCQD